MFSARACVLWCLLALFVIGAAAVIGGSLWVRAFLRGDDFRRLVSVKTGEALNSKATYSPLRWAGSSLFADSLEARGTPGSIVEGFRADQVRAALDWRAAWGGVWRVDRIDIVNFEGTFRKGSSGGRGNAREKAPRAAGLAALLPQRFELGELNIRQARVGFQGAGGQEIVRMENAALQVRPDGEGWTIEGTGGTLAVSGLPLLDITRFRSRLQGDAFFLTEANLRLGETGKIAVTGEFADDSHLRLEWSQVDVGTFLDSLWKSRLSGRLAGTALIQWPEAGWSAGTTTGTFRLTEGLLQNLPVLDDVAAFTGASQFRRMPLQELSGNYQWSKGALTITNLVAESAGLMRVEGACKVAADGALSGTMRVGVTPQTLQWLPGSRERVFTVAQNGYVWCDVRIGGTLRNPTEDLSARLVHAMKDEAISRGEEVIDLLPAPAATSAKDVLDILKPLIP